MRARAGWNSSHHWVKIMVSGNHRFAARSATLGIVTGDRKFARVNSGEMILNKFQQTRLFNMVNGSNYQMPSFSDRSIQPVIYDMGGLANSLQPPVVNVDISMNPKFRRMVEFIRNEEKVAGKSGNERIS